MSRDTNACTVRGYNLNGPGAAQTARDLASTSTQEPTMANDTPYTHERKSEAY